MVKQSLTRRATAALLLLALLGLLAGCSAPTARETPAAEVTIQPMTAPPATPSPTPEPTPELPVETPDDPCAPPGPCVGVEADGTFSDKVLFIGDSLTASLILNMRILDRLGAARYMAICTYSMQSFYGAPFLNDYSQTAYGMECSYEFYNLSYAQAVAQAGESVGAIYFMLGTNASREVTPELYFELMSYLRTCCPDAVIYAQTIPYSRWELSDYEGVNATILRIVEDMRASGDKNIYVLDTFQALGTEYMLDDGLHLSGEGLDVWYRLLAADLAKD